MSIINISSPESVHSREWVLCNNSNLGYLQQGISSARTIDEVVEPLHDHLKSAAKSVRAAET